VRVRHPGSESLAAADQIRQPLSLMRGDSVPQISENLPPVLDVSRQLHCSQYIAAMRGCSLSACHEKKTDKVYRSFDCCQHVKFRRIAASDVNASMRTASGNAHKSFL
jgi:hypothetical protein